MPCIKCIIPKNGGFMKRLFYILLFFSVSLLLFCPSCKADKKDPFDGIPYPFTSKITLLIEGRTIKGQLTLQEERATLTLQGNTHTEDISFSFTREGAASISLRDRSFPISPSRLPEKGLLFHALWNTRDADFIKSSVTEDGEKMVLYTLVKGTENLLIYTDSNNTPKKIVIEGAYPLTVLFEE